MIELIVTYGRNHRDTKGRSLGGCYSVVRGKDYEACRIQIFEVRGPRFATTYPTTSMAGVKRYSLKKIPIEPSCPICPVCNDAPCQEGEICARCDLDVRR